MGTPATQRLGSLHLKAGTITGIADFSTGATSLEFLTENVVLQQQRAHSDGIRGSRSKREERVRIIQEAVGGSISFNPTPVELDTLLPLILGADEATDVFAVADTMKEFGLLFDRVTNRFVYTGCYVSRARFNITQGQPVELQLEILGKTEIVSSTAAPSLSIDAGSIYIPADLTYSLAADASAAEVRNVSIVIDNMLDGNRFLNSTTRTAITSTGRNVMVEMLVPYTDDEKDLYDTALSANDNSTITLTNGGVSTTFTFGQIEFSATTPQAQGRGGEYFLQLRGQAFATSSADEIKVTHDSVA